MPKQETFFEETTGDLKIEVIKTYDHLFAREAFDGMNEAAGIPVAFARNR